MEEKRILTICRANLVLVVLMDAYLLYALANRLFYFPGEWEMAYTVHEVLAFPLILCGGGLSGNIAFPLRKKHEQDMEKRRRNLLWANLLIFGIVGMIIVVFTGWLFVKTDFPLRESGYLQTLFPWFLLLCLVCAISAKGLSLLGALQKEKIAEMLKEIRDSLMR